VTSCKDCGAVVLVGIRENGLKVQLDARAPVYRLAVYDASTGGYDVARVIDARVPHRLVCPKSATPASRAPAAGAAEPRR